MVSYSMIMMLALVFVGQEAMGYNDQFVRYIMTSTPCSVVPAGFHFATIAQKWRTSGTSIGKLNVAANQRNVQRKVVQDARRSVAIIQINVAVKGLNAKRTTSVAILELGDVGHAN